ncbi:MAG: enoyl-CoA hydratase/isomerase family protein [Chloroflexi bacterium]|nr:enoyl-CoA hydratase/isomerase family protein [Chloroflexota bacterium]
MPFEAIAYERQDGVGLLTLRRPEKLNTFNAAMRREVREVFASVNDDPEVRCLVITGAGDRAFCAGADQTERSDGGAIPLDEVRRHNLDPNSSTAKYIQEIEKPIVAAVNGVAAGGGLAMVLGSDVAIASDRARFRVAHRDLGMAAMDALGWLLPRAVGKQRAFEMYATNRIVEAEEAERVGLVLKVVPHAELMTETMDLARTLADGPPIGLKMTKRAILRGSTHSLEEYLEFERLAYQNCYFSEDSKEARKAFLEKRPPKFQGR